MTDTEPNYDKAALDITRVLRAIMLHDGVDLLAVALWGEEYPDFLRPWFDRIARRPNHTGVVTCTPWVKLNFTFSAATASEACVMLANAVFRRVFPDKPPVEVTSGTISDIESNLDAYLEQNEVAMQRRLFQVYASVNSAEWSKLLAMAELERASTTCDDADPHEAAVLAVTYNISGLTAIIACDDNQTARNYLEAAGLPVAIGRGKRQTYSLPEAEQFARQVIAAPTTIAHREAAERWLERHAKES